MVPVQAHGTTAVSRGEVTGESQLERKERLGTKTGYGVLYSNEKHSAMVICKNVMILQHNSKQGKKKSCCSR